LGNQARCETIVLKFIRKKDLGISDSYFHI